VFAEFDDMRVLMRLMMMLANAIYKRLKNYLHFYWGIIWLCEFKSVSLHL